MLPPDLAIDLASEIRADIDRAKAAILDALLARLDRLAAVVPLDLPQPDADEDEAQGSATDDGVMIFDLERLAEVWPGADADADADKAPAPEPVDADEYRAMVRPAPVAEPEPEPEPDEFAVVRAAPAAVEAPPEPPKRPRRRTPPPPPAPLPGPVDEAVEGAPDDDGFGSIPF